MANQPIRFLRLAEVLRRIPYSAPHIWRLEQAGKFPRRAHLGANRVAWVEAEIDQWIAERLAAREQDCKSPDDLRLCPANAPASQKDIVDAPIRQNNDRAYGFRHVILPNVCF